QATLADRTVLPMGQADLEDQALLPNVRKCRAHPERGGPHPLPSPGHGPGRPRDCPEPASLRPPRARQPDAQAPTRPAARTRTTAPAQYQSVELQTMLNLNRTAVGLTRQSISCARKTCMDARVEPAHDE